MCTTALRQGWRPTARPGAYWLPRELALAPPVSFDCHDGGAIPSNSTVILDAQGS